MSLSGLDSCCRLSHRHHHNQRSTHSIGVWRRSENFCEAPILLFALSFQPLNNRFRKLSRNKYETTIQCGVVHENPAAQNSQFIRANFCRQQTCGIRRLNTSTSSYRALHHERINAGLELMLMETLNRISDWSRAHGSHDSKRTNFNYAVWCRIRAMGSARGCDAMRLTVKTHL